MAKLDHLAIVVRDYQVSRDWYCRHFGFTVEFEVPDAKTAAVRDEAGLTVFLFEDPAVQPARCCIFTLRVADVDETYRQFSAAGVPFVHPPQKVFWGYGAELLDPDGYPLRLWDEVSMREKGG